MIAEPRMEGAFQILQILTLLLSILLLYTNVKWMTINKERLLNGVAIFFVAVHTVVYYVVVILERYNFIVINNSIIFFSSWSTILRTHTIVALITMEVLRIQYTRMKQR